MPPKDKTPPAAPPLPEGAGAEIAPGAATPLGALADQVEGAQLQAVTDADLAGIPAEPEGPPPTPNNVLVAQLLGAVRDTVCTIADLEAPRRTLTDEKCAKLGDIWGGVLDHYGVQLSEKMGKHSVLITAVLATAPLLGPVVIETRKEIAIKDGKKPAAAPGAAAIAPAPPAGQIIPAGGYRDGEIKPRFPQ